jgi:Tol biopolymer transport system component
LDLQVHTVEIASGNVVQLTNLTGVGTRVSWSPDGKRILFDLGMSSNPNLFTIAPDGTNLTQLTQCPVVCNDGHFSPDGKQIAFIYGGQVARMTAAGNNIKMLTSLADPQPHWPSWSPDGKQLAYERYAGAYAHDIWVLTVANGSAAALVTNRLDDTTPSWTR